MYSTTDPTVGTFVGFIVGPTDVLTTDIHTPMGLTADIAAIISLIPTADIIPTPMEAIVRTRMGLIVGMCVVFIVVHIDGDITDAIVGHESRHSVQ
jgi:predicted ABC-type sugar transport system permease subunit